MFERFTDSARQIVRRGQESARELRQPRIGTEHILLALLELDQADAASDALHSLGVDTETVRAEIARRGRRTGLSEADSAALREIGIDLAMVRAKLEETFGPGALDAPPAEGGRPGGPGKFRPFAKEAKKTLELALREALRLKHRHIAPAHILLGMLRANQGMAVSILADAGVDLDELRRRIQNGIDKAA